MKNLHLESWGAKMGNNAKRIIYAPDTQTPILDATSQRMVQPRMEIQLNRRQFNETRWLFTQYGLKAPSWLRSKFLLNQYRRKCLNDNLREAQLDRAFCGSCNCLDDWCGLLHLLWHDINGVEKCI